jgi:hypothetical protein
MELTKKLTPAWIDLEFEGEKLGFYCRPLASHERITAMALAEDGKVGEAMMQTIAYSVRDWRGITEKGESVKFTPLALEQLFADGAWSPQLMALASMIGDRSTLSEIERKKS